MRAVVSTIGRFHSFNQARQLQEAGALAAVFSGYPRGRLRDTGVDPALIHTFPYLQAPYMALCRFNWFQRRLEREWSWRAQCAHDRHVARRLPACDAVIALSGMGLETGRVARGRGGRHLCDRGSTHKLVQDAVLRAEYHRHGFSWPGIDPRSIAKELQEYEEADAILVPSSFVRRTFLDQGVPEAKLRLCPYGADLTRFRPLAPKADRFTALFVGQLGLRKGLSDLLEAFRRAAPSGGRLVLVGMDLPETATLTQRVPVPGLELKGMLKGEDLVREMSAAHVLVLPSVEEGLAMVMAEAMACGTPVLATPETGAEDLFTDGVEGFIVPSRSPDILAERLSRLAGDPALRRDMSAAALARVVGLDGWGDYGRRLLGHLRDLCGEPE